MYLKIDNDEFADGDFYFLETFIKVIDTELSKLDLRIKNSADPDADGLCDFGEYLIGYGFLAIQRYIASTYPQTKIKKNDSLKFGPKTNDDLFLAEVLNEAANYWKHEDEWPIILTKELSEDSAITMCLDLNKRQGITFDTVDKIANARDYRLSNLLAELLKKHTDVIELQFSPLLPFIESWRNDLDKNATENHRIKS